MKDGERYLFDRTGAPDPQVAELERLLGRFRHRPAPLELERAPVQGRRAAAWRAAAFALAAAALVALIGLGPWRARPAVPADGVRYELRGDASGTARLGDRIDAGAGGVAFDVGELGSVVLDPGARLRVEQLAGAEHGFFLERGALHASILAAPRTFQVGTPAGLSVDLGCVYSLEVEDDGGVRMAVQSGRIAFETAGRSVIVPAGARCSVAAGSAPNAPLFDDAEPTFAAAVRALEASTAPDEAPLAALAERARERDGLTLFHLARYAADGRVRAAAARALERACGALAGASAEALSAGDPRAVQAWSLHLGAQAFAGAKTKRAPR